MSNPSQPPVPPKQEGASAEQAEAAEEVVDPRAEQAEAVEEVVDPRAEQAEAVEEVVDPRAEQAEAVEEVVDPLLRALSPEDAVEISRLLRQPDEGVTQNSKYGRRFQVVHLSMFFLLSNDAQKAKQVRIKNYLFNYNLLVRAYNFRIDPSYRGLFEKGFEPVRFIEEEKGRVRNHFHAATTPQMKKNAFLAFKFANQLGEYLHHPLFTPFATEYVAFNCRLNIQDDADTRAGNKPLIASVQQLWHELCGYMFEYFTLKIDDFLKIRVPGKQCAAEMKFYQARKEYYMTVDFDSIKTAIVAYCYHMIAIHIEYAPNKGSNLMILVFTDLRKLKLKLQGNAKELDQAAAKTLEEAEYEALIKVLGLKQWEPYLQAYY